MENENINEVPVQTEPSNMEEALKLLREKDKAPAAENVEGTEANGSGAESEEHGSERGEQHGGSVAQDDLGAEQPTPVTNEGYGEPGGSADSIEQTDTTVSGIADYDEVQQNLLQSIRRQAAMATNEKFKQEGIEKITLTQLYQRDENTGRVTFYNPDNPDIPFDNRAQAQAWVDSYNQQVETEWVNYANRMQQEYAQQALPAARLMQFAPTYDAMDERTRKFFDVIINPYGVKDSTGALIGFSCDLNAAAAQARQLAEIEGGQTTQSIPQTVDEAVDNVASGPALDAVTTGSDTTKGSSKEPKNLNDAWKMINQKKKGNK